ncbi:hypothetical protein [Calothrix rhizosoleniae]|uniref:hypothetical protein n=1 Tax=Calothrix rhizosoleniae TaxID=888997 RepID=UPI000B496F40|nr:hypothetical protein [Calothrix rhizosoleniae]
MNISNNSSIPFARSLVYPTFQDKLVELVPYMPNVLDIEVKSRQEKDGKIYCVNEWHGGGDIPMAARAIISEEMLSWTEYNTWKVEDFTLEWSIKTHAFTEAVSCGGINRFLEKNGNTVIESRGELIIDPKKIKGVPQFISGQIAHVVEEFLGQKIKPNLLQMSEGVRKYLEENPRS